MENILELFERADPFETWWPTIVAVTVAVVFTIRNIMRGQRCPNANNIRGRVVIVTGGSGGIGVALAKALAFRGGRVIIACRDLEAGQRAAARIRRELQRCHRGHRNNGVGAGDAAAAAAADDDNDEDAENAAMAKRIQVRQVDLCSLESVRGFARDMAMECDRIDVLVNNAGVIFQPAPARTGDGFEHHLQVNYLAHFLLAQLLLPQLRRSDNGRIVNVSAHAYAVATMDADDPLNVGTWAVPLHARDAFAHSKLAIILASKWLAKELKGTRITVNACTPGLVRGTGHLRSSPLMSMFCIKVMTYPWMWLFMKSPSDGAQCALRLATDPQLKSISGEYFNDCEIAPTSEMANDMQLAKKLYEQTLMVLDKWRNPQLFNEE